MADNSLSFNISALDRASKTFIDLAATVDKLSSKLDELGAREAKPEVDVETAKAQADLDALDAYLDVIGKKDETAKVNVDTKDAESAMNSFEAKWTLIGAGIIAAAPIAGAAILAGLGGAFAAVGILAEKGNAQVAQSFTQAEDAAKKALTDGFAPIAPVLVGLSQQAGNAASNLEGTFRQAAEATAPLLQAVGVDLIDATQKGVQDSAAELNSLAPIAHAVGQDFLDAEQGIAGFLKNLDVGDAAQTLSLIGDVAKDDLPAIGNLVSAIAPLTNTILSLLDPAIKDTANDLALLKPLFQAVDAVVTPLAPMIGALAPPLLATAAASKLLTGSWLDFGGAAQKITAPLNDVNGTLTSLANKLGVTTAAQNAATKAGLQQAASTTAMKSALTDEASAQALVAFQQDASIKNLTTLDAALAEQVAAAEAAASAEEALAGAEEGATLAMGPMGLILGVIGAALVGYVSSSNSATTSTQTMSGELGKLEQSAGQGANALAQLFGQDANAKQLSDTLAKYGVTTQTLTQAQNGNVAAQQQVTAALKQAQQAAQSKLDTDKQAYDQLTTNATVVGAQGQTYTTNANAVKQAADAMNQDKTAVSNATDSYNDAKNAVADTTDALKEQGITLSASQGFWNLMGSSLQSASQSFQTATSGLKYMFDAQNTSITTASQAAQAQTQLKEAVTQAQEAYNSAANGVSQANYQVTQSAQGVSQAQHGVQNALQGVASAEQALTNAEQTETNAQNALIQARAAAIAQMQQLQLQVADQSDSVASAQVNLFDAQQAVTAGGLQGQSLANFGPITTANEANYKLLLQLSQAQDAYNDALSQQQQIQQQNASAQQQGENGNSSVLSAQQQLVSSQQGVAAATQQVSDAQYSQQQASLALKNAQYEQQQASLAVQQAAEQEQQARLQLSTAVNNNTTDTQGNSVAAANNRTSIEQMYEANVNLYGPTQQAADITEQQGQAAGYTKSQVDAVIGSLGGLNGQVSTFSIVGTPSLNLTALIQQALQQGLDPYSFGIPAAQVDLARGPTGASYASGGYISGEGGPTDDMIPAWLSNGEFVVNAQSAATHRGLLEQINAPGFASGGSINTNGPAVLGVNFRLGMWDGLLASTSKVMQGLGWSAPNLPNNPGPIDFGAFAVPSGGGGGNTAGGNATPAQGGSAAQAQAYAASQLANFGWGQDQMPDLIKLWNQESGWNDNAVNKSSGAYGIPQSLGHGHPYNLGDYAAQIQWGLNYIKGRYGSPDAAWAHEVAYNWYAKGGPVTAAALTPPSGADVHRSYMVPGMAAGGPAGATASGDTHFHLNVHNAGNNNVDIRSQYRRMEILANI